MSSRSILTATLLFFCPMRPSNSATGPQRTETDAARRGIQQQLMAWLAGR